MHLAELLDLYAVERPVAVARRLDRARVVLARQRGQTEPALIEWVFAPR